VRAGEPALAKPVAGLPKAERLRLLRALDRRGVFHLRGAEGRGPARHLARLPLRRPDRLRAHLDAHGTPLRPHVKPAMSVDVAWLAFDGEGFTDIVYAVGIAPSTLDLAPTLRPRNTTPTASRTTRARPGSG
jgi:hypothetical protein